MKERITGTIDRFTDNYGSINADDGDLYYFRTKRKFNMGDRVEFEPDDSILAFDLALIGGPIPCKKVKHI